MKKNIQVLWNNNVMLYVYTFDWLIDWERERRLTHVARKQIKDLELDYYKSILKKILTLIFILIKCILKIHVMI